MNNNHILPRMEVDEKNEDHGEFDEIEPDGSSMEGTSPLPLDKLDALTTTNTNNDNDNNEPEPGSAKWYETRKLNHKNVERRRRETIKLAMDELVTVIPGNEKNKSKILKRAVQHIKQLGGQVIALRIQNEEYRKTNQQQQVEITELKRRLDTQQQQQEQ